MVCLDSDIIIDFFRKRDYAIKKIKELREKNIGISTTSVNTFELFRGFIDSEKYSPEIFSRFLNNVNILHFDFDSSKKAAEIFEDLRAKGELLDLADIMIAAVVINNDETILTGNIKHFKRISRLKVEEIGK